MERQCFLVDSQALLFISMDILLLGSYTRFSCSIIKWNTHQAKTTIPSFQLHPIPSSPTGLTHWPINKFHVRKLNRRQCFPCFTTIFIVLNTLIASRSQIANFISIIQSKMISVCLTVRPSVRSSVCSLRSR